MQEKAGRSYLDTWAAPGSALCAAIEDKNWTEALFIYRETEVEYQRWNGSKSDYALALAKYKTVVAERKAKAEVEASQLIAENPKKKFKK